jgi:hypothetical protein
MARINDWYQSKKGWIVSIAGVVFFVLDFKGRMQSALDIYREAPGWCVSLSPYIAPLMFALAILLFEIQRRKGQSALPAKSKKTKGTIQWRVGVYGFVIALFVAASVWSLTRPNVTAEILGTAIGDFRGTYPSASIMVGAAVNNIGPPTTINDWKLSVKLRNGETVSGVKVDKAITAFLDVGGHPLSKTDPPRLVVDTKDQLWAKTGHTPIPTGGSEDGYIGFIFYGVTRDHINEPGNVLTLEFKDAHRHSYGVDYVVQATGMVVQTDPGSD